MAHDAVGVGDDKVGEVAVVFFKSVGALYIWLTRHFRAEVSELLTELLDLTLGLEVLECTADGCVGETDGDGAKGSGVELRLSPHDFEEALGGQGVVAVVDARYDLAFFGVRVGGNGEMWAFGGSVDGLGGWCTRERDGGWIDEGDGGGGEFWLDRLCGYGGLDVIDRGIGFDGGRHVVVV